MAKRMDVARRRRRAARAKGTATPTTTAEAASSAEKTTVRRKASSGTSGTTVASAGRTSRAQNSVDEIEAARRGTGTATGTTSVRAIWCAGGLAAGPPSTPSRRMTAASRKLPRNPGISGGDQCWSRVVTMVLFQLIW